MLKILEHVKHRIQGKIPRGARRSDEWPRVRKEHLEKFPTCAICQGTKNLEVHHKIPFHKNPALELSPTNLITLCESKKNGVNCHLLFGHLGNFKAENKQVENDSAEWQTKIRRRFGADRPS